MAKKTKAAAAKPKKPAAPTPAAKNSKPKSAKAPAKPKSPKAKASAPKSPSATRADSLAAKYATLDDAKSALSDALLETIEDSKRRLHAVKRATSMEELEQIGRG